MSTRPGDSHQNDLNEGSWVYLAASADHAGQDVRQRLVEACEASGWPAVSWVRSLGLDDGPPGLEQEIETVRHAVAHADVVVVLIHGGSDLSETELKLAREHRRPVVALCHSGADQGAAEGQAGSLRDYDRATLVFCESPDQCGAQLRSALADPRFGAKIVEAASEPSSYA